MVTDLQVRRLFDMQNKHEYLYQAALARASLARDIVLQRWLRATSMFSTSRQKSSRAL